MAVDIKTVAELRARTNAGMVDCKTALDEAGGDIDKAADILRKKGIAKADKKGDRQVKEGLVHAYIHGAGQVGAMVEVLCETDFVARNEQFQDFVHDLAMQVAATNPLYLTSDEIPAEVLEKERELASEEFAGSGKPAEVITKIVEGKLSKYYEQVCLLDQRFIKDEDLTIRDHLKNNIARIGENIQIRRFVRFALSSGGVE
ncbi:translation elongation factor Ts [Candidatus Uhrbacteria bacterium RIFOXYC2_FULL_47_19]|uniref:Elongation factor Ts n=1 Tax=Candidatus Uhrbacteria bacterium RIFOXYC2_FULL_47_19 TaxID=1802424 RepID=A0A1F7WF32_9BACT|nr:MAG: translation elongation factor Ts [Candidatus Uhrbacteria bacterium RIFOXYC2_FULL_47_19]HCC21879.1 translation elongation factor Ts [Candidatus Uhrbacteria bacterium]